MLIREVEPAHAVVEREWQGVLARLGGLTDAQWLTPTRCTGWTVADLVRHNVRSVSMAADALRRLHNGEHGPADGIVLGPDTEPAELLESLRQGSLDLYTEMDRLTGDDVERYAPMPIGPVPMQLAVDVFAMEAAVHASDMAEAFDVVYPLSTGAVVSTQTALAAFFPGFAAAGSPPPSEPAVLGMFGPTVGLRVAVRSGDWVVDPAAEPTAWVQGSDSDVLMYALGRIPADDSRLTVGGDGRLVAAFKQYLPGP